MNSEFILSVLGLAFFPVLTMTIGGIIASYKTPKAKMRSILHHFAAGVVFAVVSVELLPDVMKEHNIFVTAVGFAAGVALMIGLKHLFSGGEKHKESENFSPSFLTGVGVDVLIDGLLIGIVFAAGAKQGKLLAFALATEMFTLGLALGVMLGEAKIARPKVIGIVGGLALLIFAGAAVGATVLQNVSKSVMDFVLSFGLAALLFLVVEELLIEAHEEPETPFITATFFIGFLLFLILGMVS